MYWNRYRRTKNQEGSALVASLLVVMLVAGMGAGLIQVQSAMMRRQLLGIDRTRALYVAEAGLSESFLAISQGKTGRIGTVDDLAQYDDGVFWVEAEEQASGDIVLTSTGLCGQGRFSLSVVVTPPTSPIGTLGFFGIDSLTINEESIIDGFDPTLGTFQDQVVAGGATDGGARLRSNGDIDIRGSLGVPSERGGKEGEGSPGTETYILGDVIPGPDGLVSLESGVTVTGNTTPAYRTVDVPQVLLPDLGDLGVLERSTPESFNVGPGEVWLGNVDVPEGITATLVGPMTLVTKSLTVDSTGLLNFDATNGPITVYVLSELSMMPNSTLGHLGGNADQISVFVDELSATDGTSAPTLDIRQVSGEFHGMLYAPACDVTVPSSLRIFGGVVAKNLVLQSGSRVTFDSGLHRAMAGVESSPELKSWVVEELPDEPICKTRKNPFKYIEEEGLAVTKADVAHAETRMKITYQDNTGTTRTYDGDAALIDWTDVKLAYKVQWEDPDTGIPMKEIEVLNSIRKILP
tara:strand:+ start:5036 stop:6598 length:1563 start_codon:yes stop_codon:yes gene_type:complete